MFVRHDSNWKFTAPARGLECRVFLSISPSGLVRASTRALDGTLLAHASGTLVSYEYRDRWGARKLGYFVQTGEVSLERERRPREAAHRLASHVIEETLATRRGA